MNKAPSFILKNLHTNDYHHRSRPSPPPQQQQQQPIRRYQPKPDYLTSYYHYPNPFYMPYENWFFTL